MSDNADIRPTARLVAAGWGAIAAGVAVLVAVWFLGFGKEPGYWTDTAAPIGWVALLAGIGSLVWAAVRRARNRELVQRRQLER